MGAGEGFDHRVDAAFQRVRGRFQGRRIRIVSGGEVLCDGEVVEQVTSAVDGEQAVVGFAQRFVSPGPANAHRLPAAAVSRSGMRVSFRARR